MAARWRSWMTQNHNRQDMTHESLLSWLHSVCLPKVQKNIVTPLVPPLCSELWKELEVDSEREEALEKIYTAVSPHFSERSHLLPHPFISASTLLCYFLMWCKRSHTVPCQILSSARVHTRERPGIPSLPPTHTQNLLLKVNSLEISMQKTHHVAVLDFSKMF